MLEFIEQLCSSVCHTLPERTILFGTRPLPLCARCVGVYVGFLLTMAWLALTPLRNRTLVPRPLLWCVVAVITLFAAVGFAGLYGWVSISRSLRLLLGLFFGSALAVLAFPLARAWMLGMAVENWQQRDSLRFAALPVLLLLAGAIIGQGLSPLYWPILLAALAGLIGSHFLADLLILSWLMKRRRAWSPGLGFTLAALAALMCVGEFFFYAAWRRWWQVL